MQNVCGEIYEIDDTALEEIDKFENHPILYTRDVIWVEYTSDADDTDIKSEQKKIRCYTYLLKDFKPELLELPFIENYGPEECKLVTLSKDITSSDDVVKYISHVK